MTRCTSRTSAIAFLLGAATLSVPSFGQTQLPDRFFPPPGVASWPLVQDPATLGMNAEKLTLARQYAETKLGAGIIARRGHKVAEWGNPNHRYPVMSVTKGVGALLLGLAVDDGLVALEDTAAQHYPNVGIPPLTNGEGQAGDWRTRLTIEQLATHSSGFDNTRRIEGTASVAEPRMRFEPGTVWVYSDGAANALADTLTVRFGKDLREVLHDEILIHLGLTLRRTTGQGGDIEWRARPLDPTLNGIERREFNSGLSMKVDAMARFGLLIESDGEWNGTRILSSQYLDRMAAPSPAIQGKGLPIRDTGGRDVTANFPGVTEHLGLLWFNNDDGALPEVPRDAMWTWGDGDHLIVVIPSLDIVIARTSNVEGNLSQRNAWQTCPIAGVWCTQYEFLEPFLTPIAQSVEGEPPPPPPPPPPGAPTVTLTPSATEVATGGTVRLDWSSANADSCTAANGWEGTKPTTGSETVTVTQTTTYTLSCSGAAGTTEQSVTVTATSTPNPPPPPPEPPGGGGGGALQWWMLAGLLLAGGARRGLRLTRRRAAFAG